ncbi:MAG: hypothetical protein ACI9U2_003444 [Bradymonadia bacterium]|jgi:hypothetical protein
MRLILVFIILSCVTSGCSKSGGTAARGLLVSKPMTVEPGSGLALDEVAKRLKKAVHTSLGVSPAVLVEYQPGLDSIGAYSLAGSYSSLAALATDLEGQYASYTWEVLAGDVLVVRPSENSYLASVLPAGSYDAPALCDLLRTFGQIAFPNTRPTRPTTCMYRGVPQYRADIPELVFSQQALFGGGFDPVVSVSVASGDRVMDAVVTAFDTFGFRFSASIAPIVQSTSIPPTWMLSF